MSFLNSLSNNSTKYDNPFDHWELNKPLTEEQINEIVNADIVTSLVSSNKKTPANFKKLVIVANNINHY